MISIIFLPIGAYTITKTWKIMTLSSSPKVIYVEVEKGIKQKKY